jgi:hypothetical protein
MRTATASLAALADRMQQESRFLSEIEAVRPYRLEDSTPRLLDESQAERLRLSGTGKSDL